MNSQITASHKDVRIGLRLDTNETNLGLLRLVSQNEKKTVLKKSQICSTVQIGGKI